MKILIVMWILSLLDLSGQKIIYNGTLENCLEEAIRFNEEEKEALAGCYAEVRSPDYLDKGAS